MLIKKNQIKSLISKLSFAILLIAQISNTQAMNLQDRFRGWFWYEDKKAKKAVIDTQKKVPKILVEDGKKTPTELVMEHRKLLDAKKHKALVNPTVENVADYLYYQKATLDRTLEFQKSWQRAIYLHPELDPAQKEPVSVAGLKVSYELKRKQREDELKRLSKRSGLIYFYSSNCRYCHAFAPTVKNFADKYGFKVIAISSDGRRLGVFKDERKNNGIIDSLGINGFPTLVALDTKTNNMIRLTSGMVTEDELAERAFVLSAHLKGEKK